MILTRWVPVFDFKGVLLVDSVHVHNKTGFEDGVELHRHAETTKHHVSVTVLGAECLVGDFQTWRAVDGAVNPGYLQDKMKSACIPPIADPVILYQQICHYVCLLRCGCGPSAR